MANSYLLETLRETAAINGLQIATLIGSLSRSVALLTVDIDCCWRAIKACRMAFFYPRTMS
jgi:hypothetical protein